MGEAEREGPPERLRRLVSWQSGRVALLGTRLTTAQMPLEVRADFAVLACLLERGGLSQIALGRMLGFDRKNLHDIVRRLEARHLVDKRPDPDDGRRTVIDVTAAGRAHFADLDRRAGIVQEQLLAPLEPAERAELQRLLLKVLAAAPDLPA